MGEQVNYWTLKCEVCGGIGQAWECEGLDYDLPYEYEEATGFSTLCKSCAHEDINHILERLGEQREAIFEQMKKISTKHHIIDQRPYLDPRKMADKEVELATAAHFEALKKIKTKYGT